MNLCTGLFVLLKDRMRSIVHSWRFLAASNQLSSISFQALQNIYLGLVITLSFAFYVFFFNPTKKKIWWRALRSSFVSANKHADARFFIVRMILFVEETEKKCWWNAENKTFFLYLMGVIHYGHVNRKSKCCFDDHTLFSTRIHWLLELLVKLEVGTMI